MKLSDIPAGLLRGTRLHLAAPALDSVPAMHRLISDFSQPHAEFLIWANGTASLEDARVNMQTAVDNFSADKNEYKFLIIENSSDALVGCISLFIHDLRIPYLEIGYWIGSASMGKGYASEACALVRDIAVEFFNAKRIALTTAARNTRSIRVAERCGFECEAVLSNARIDKAGVVDDTCVYVFKGASAK